MKIRERQAEKRTDGKTDKVKTRESDTDRQTEKARVRDVGLCA